MSIYCNDDLHLGVVWIGVGTQQFVRIQVGQVKVETMIVSHNFNPKWNQVYVVIEDKIQGRTLELTVWDAVHAFPSLASLQQFSQLT
jgi:Ca2+-dependent lipid-binding protein